MTWNADIIIIITITLIITSQEEDHEDVAAANDNEDGWHVIPEAVANTIWSTCWAVILQLCWYYVYAKIKSKF